MEDKELEQRIARLKPQQRAWFNAYVADPGRNATEAARIAGYGKTDATSSSIGRSLKSRLKDLIEAYDVRLRDAAIVSPREVQELLGKMARAEGQVRDSDRLKALELIARIHGMLSEKLSVEIDISLAKKQLGGLFSSSGKALPAPSSSNARLVGNRATVGNIESAQGEEQEPLEAEIVDPGAS